jgi:hypothetical protein
MPKSHEGANDQSIRRITASGFACFGPLFVIKNNAAVANYPDKSVFYNPTLWQDLETILPFCFSTSEYYSHRLVFGAKLKNNVERLLIFDKLMSW